MDNASIPALVRANAAVAAPLCAGLSLLAVPAVRADVLYTYTDATHYSYAVTDMPDFDQRRNDDMEPGIPGLPNNGSMWCAPTSFTNVMAYLSSRGFLQLSPIGGVVPISWQSQAVYDEVNAGLELIGDLMGTDPEDGTSGAGFLAGADAWFAQDPRVVLDNYYAFEDWAPTERTLHEAGRFGGLVVFCYGRYVVLDEKPGFLTTGSRVGGHVITLQSIARSGLSFTLKSRDPADSDDSRYAQSIFSAHVYTLARPSFVEVGGTSFTRPMLQLDAVSASDRVALVDGVTVLRPRAILGWDPTGDLVHITIPKPFGPGTPPISEFDPLTSSLTPLHDAIMAPDWGGMYFTTRSLITGGTGRLAYLDFTTGERTNLRTISAQGAHLIAGRSRELYLVDNGLVQCFDVTDTGVALRAQVTAPASVTDIAFDDATDELVLLSLSGQSVSRFPAWLAGAPTTRVLPAGVPAAADGSVRVEPANGQVWIHAQGFNALYGLIPNPAGPPLEVLTDPALTSVKSFDFDDHGRLFVQSGGVIHEFARGAGGGGSWQPASSSPSGFDGVPARSRFTMLKGRTNRRAEHEGPAWHNVDPSELYPIGVVQLDCVADLDDDGSVAISDLLAVLGDWGSCSVFGCSSDMDGNGAVDIGDLLILLGSWGPCPE